MMAPEEPAAEPLSVAAFAEEHRPLRMAPPVEAPDYSKWRDIYLREIAKSLAVPAVMFQAERAREILRDRILSRSDQVMSRAAKAALDGRRGWKRKLKRAHRIAKSAGDYSATRFSLQWEHRMIQLQRIRWLKAVTRPASRPPLPTRMWIFDEDDHYGRP